MSRVKFRLTYPHNHSNSNSKIKSTQSYNASNVYNAYMYIYILADAIVHHMITVTCIPDKMSNEKEKKREREKEKIKGKER